MISLLLTALLGYLISNYLIKTDDKFETAAISLGLGVGTFSVLVTINLLFSPFNEFIVNLSLLLLIVVFVLLNIYKKDDKLINHLTKTYLRNPKTFRYLKYFLAILLIVFVFIILSWPIHAWDALTLHDFRARYFVEANTLSDLGELNSFDKNRESYYFSYPLLVTNINLLAHIAGIDNPKFLYFAFVVSFLYLFYKFLLRYRIDKSVALLIVILTFTHPTLYEIFRIAYSNSIYIYYYLGAFIFLAYWVDNGLNKNLYISALLLAFAIQTRFTEPLFLAMFVVLMVNLYRNKRNLLRTSTYVLIVLGSYFFWPYVQKFLNLSFPNKRISYLENLFIGIKEFSFQRAIEVTIFFTKSFIVSFGFLFVLLFLTFIVHYYYLKVKRISRESLYFPAMIISVIAIFFIGTYLLSFSFARWNKIPKSLQRAALPLVPLTFSYSGILIFSDKWNK